MKVWGNLAMFIFIFIASIFVIRKAAEMNKAVLCAIIFVVISCVGLNWVYARNEPKFLTPIVEKIAPFFPSAGSYANKQATAPK